MAGRFRIYTDADIHGPLVQALKRRSWDLVRAVDAYPEGQDDRTHFEHAAKEGRVLVSNDVDQIRAPSVMLPPWSAVDAGGP